MQHGGRGRVYTKAFYFAKNSRRYEKKAAYNAAVCVAICPAKAKVNITAYTFGCASFVLRKCNSSPILPSTAEKYRLVGLCSASVLGC